MNAMHAAWGRKLQQQRESRHLSRTQLADKAGVSRQYIRLIELGLKVPSDTVRINVAQALGASANSIFDLEVAQ